MHGVRAHARRRVQQRLDVEVGVLQRGWADAAGLVCVTHERGVAVRLGEDRRRAPAQPSSRGEHPAGDLAPIGDQQLHSMAFESVWFIAGAPLCYIRYTMPLPAAGASWRAANDRQSPSASRVSAGSMSPSSHSRAVA